MASIEKRRREDGSIGYTATVRLSGFPTRCATFDKLADARDWAHGLESDIRAGRLGSDVIARSKTVGEMIDRYINNVLEAKTRKASYIRAQRQQLQWWKDQIGALKLSALTPYAINDSIECLAGQNYSRRAPGTVKRYIAALNHVIGTAIKAWGWLSANPLDKIVKPKEPRGRVRFLSPQELTALLVSCSKERKKPLGMIVKLAISCGARKGEILGIKRRDLDLKRCMAVVHDTKNGESRPLYFWSGLVEDWREWMRQLPRKSKFVFPARHDLTRPMNIEREWKRALKRARISDFRFHDLRHTHASYLAMNGADPLTILESLGQKDLKMVKRYAHLSKSHVAGAVEAMNKKIFEEGNGHA